MSSEDIKEKAPWFPAHHPWRVRLFVGLFMCLLAVIGMIITDIKQNGAWNYWRIISVLFALLSMGLSFYLRHHQWKDSVITIWHEIFHWMGLILAVFLVSVIVQLGIMGRFEASLQVLILLSFATYLAGVYIEKTFLFIGVLLGLFALGLSFVSIYLYSMVIPLAILVVIALILFVRKKSHQSTHS